jgi:hypothetical protein
LSRSRSEAMSRCSWRRSSLGATRNGPRGSPDRLGEDRRCTVRGKTVLLVEAHRVGAEKPCHPMWPGRIGGCGRRAGLAAERALPCRRRHAGPSKVHGRHIGGPAGRTISPVPRYRTPGPAEITDRVRCPGGSQTRFPFSRNLHQVRMGPSSRSGLDLPVLVFAPCLLGCPGTAR